jgi:hypothetical protein
MQMIYSIQRGPRYLRLFCLALKVWLGATGAGIADEPSPSIGRFVGLNKIEA